MNLFRNILAVFIAAFCLVLSADAQATLRSTTTSQAIAATDTDIIVASATGIEVNDLAFVDRELMRVRALNGTRLTVARGLGGIRASHASGATIYVDDPSYFGRSDKSGSCTSASEVVLPVVAVDTGTVWQCTSSVWTPISIQGAAVTGSGSAVYSVGPTITGAADISGAVLGGASPIVLEGTTADAYETTLTFTDPTADRTVTVPDQSGNVVLFANANSQDVNLIFEGTTADANETTLTFTDPTADRTVTVPNATQTVGERQAVWAQGNTVANAVTTAFFIADRAYTINKIQASWGTAETTGAMDIMPEKATGTTACGSATALLTAAVNGTGAANTVATGTLTATAADLDLAAGDRLCVKLSATPNEVKDIVVTVTMVPK